MKSATISLLITLQAAGVAAAQDRSITPTDPIVVVVGRGAAERLPDFGRVSLDVVGEGDTQVEALAALEALRAEVTEGVGALEMAEVVIDDTSDVRVERVFGPDCEADEYDPRRSTGVCAPEGYVAGMSMIFRVAPADRVGLALSLAAELGAHQVSAEDFGVLDADSLRDAAAADAFEDARSQAELVARASGGALGRVIRIQDGSANYGGSLNGIVEGVVITGSRIRRPTVQLTVTPDPVRATASLTVVFELLE